MNILVTGGAGFIGSHVADAYVKMGHRVIIVDNLSTGFKRNLSAKAKFYKVDIRNATALRSVIKKEKPHIINHHAAIAEVVKSLRDPLPTLAVNVIGTVNVLMRGGEAGIKRFIFSSTGGAIYGEPDVIPASEHTPAAPLSPYGLSKLLGEECIKFYAKQYGFDYVIFRYPNVFGPRQNPRGEAGVVAIFSDLMRNGKRPTIFGDGAKTRDYVYVDDIARANVIALSKAKDVTVNLGWGKEISDQMIFDSIAKVLNFHEKPIYAPHRKGEVCRIALQAAYAKKVLRWQPRIKPEDGIKKYLSA